LAAARAAKYDIVFGFMALFAFNAIYANGRQHLAVALGLKSSLSAFSRLRRVKVIDSTLTLAA